MKNTNRNTANDSWAALIMGILFFLAIACTPEEPVKFNLVDSKVISAGGRHSLALEANGSLWSWGSNEFGQLGDSTTIDRNIPSQIEGTFDMIAAGSNHSVAIKSDGSLWAWA